MDFAWVVDALRRGLKVTREAWKKEPPIKYLYMVQGENGKRALMMDAGDNYRFEWYPPAELMLYTDDWEEYVEPKKESVPGDTPILQFIRETTGSSGVSHVGKPVEELDLDEESNKAIALVARNIAENLVELLQNPSVQRILHG